MLIFALMRSNTYDRAVIQNKVSQTGFVATRVNELFLVGKAVGGICCQ